jgi:hypothetical protein
MNSGSVPEISTSNPCSKVHISNSTLLLPKFHKIDRYDFADKQKTLAQKVCSDRALARLTGECDRVG